jgi:hypothetical protein
VENTGARSANADDGIMSDDELYGRLRAETIELLGFNADTLTAVQSVKVDLVASLRLALDHFVGQQLAGERIDTAKLLSAAEALERLLSRSAAPEVHESRSARTKLAALLDAQAEVIDDDKTEKIATLEAEVAELRTLVMVLSSNIVTKAVHNGKETRT